MSELFEWLAFHWYVPVIIFVVFWLIIGIWCAVSWENDVKAIKEEFNLVEGCMYNVTQNNGRTLRNLTFVRIYSGRNSKNGNINLLFTRSSKYREGYIENEVVVKYGSIWKVEKLN